MKSLPPPWKQTGISLIEVLIALVIIAFGLLGVAGLQTSAIANNYRAYQYTQASVLGQNIADRMRGNLNGVIAQEYALAAGDEPADADACSDTCSSDAVAAWDLSSWYQSVADTLPAGKASIACLDSTCTSYSPWLITVYWDTNRSGATGYGCDPDESDDLACFRLVYTP